MYIFVIFFVIYFLHQHDIASTRTHVSHIKCIKYLNWKFFYTHKDKDYMYLCYFKSNITPTNIKKYPSTHFLFCGFMLLLFWHQKLDFQWVQFALYVWNKNYVVDKIFGTPFYNITFTIVLILKDFWVIFKN